MNDIDRILKERLSRRRRELGLTQQQLSEKSGVKISTIQKLESGANRVLGAETETMLRISAALEMTMDQLMDGWMGN